MGETRSSNRFSWHVQCVTCMGYMAMLTVWSMLDDCGPALAFVGQLSGWISGVLMFFRFAPQLKESLVSKTAGSVSYVTYCVSGAGGFISVYFQVMVSKERVSTWLPAFIGNCFQTAILVVCCYYDFLS